MEFHEHPDVQREPTPEALHQILDSSFTWVAKIVKEHPGNSDPISATTQEANERNIYQSLAAAKYDEYFEIKINEINYEDEDVNTAERFRLKYIFGVGEYELTTTGKQQIKSDSIDDADGSDEAFAEAIDSLRGYLEQPFYPATPEEISYFAEVVEVGVLGNAFFDFDSFEQELKDHIDGTADE
jgi:hypothetical protein